MKVAFVSGFLNNHLLPLCEELNRTCEFYFIATQNWERQGYNREVVEKQYIIKYFNDTEKKSAEDIVLNAEVVIFGGSSLSLLKLRKATGKLCFIYTERLFKKGTWRRFIPSVRKVNDVKFKSQYNNIYVLCAGSTVKRDLQLIGFDTNKCFKFGYFPILSERKLEEVLSAKDNEKMHLLYVGRLLKLKRVKDVLKCCRLLIKDGITFDLTVIGDGPEMKRLQRFKARHNLENVFFVGEKPHADVENYMVKSDILFFSSNGYEGWGAVVNEALACGCLVVGSDAAGSVKFLIKDGYNGCVYKVGSVSDMTVKTMSLIEKVKDVKLYTHAYKSIVDCWNSKAAVERFILMSNAIINNENINIYQTGPMSLI